MSAFDSASKLKIIKEIKTILGLGLKEAKEMVDGCPSTLKEKVPLEEAEALKEKLEALGCTIELK